MIKSIVIAENFEVHFYEMRLVFQNVTTLYVRVNCSSLSFRFSFIFLRIYFGYLVQEQKTCITETPKIILMKKRSH